MSVREVLRMVQRSVGFPVSPNSHAMAGELDDILSIKHLPRLANALQIDGCP